MNVAGRAFRSAATLILAAPKVLSGNGGIGNFLVQRSADTRFMPSSFVFPGGEIHNVDFNPIWEKPYFELFKSMGQEETEWLDYKRNLRDKNQPRPPLFSHYRSESLGIPPEWAFKVCALRELYEETGILVLFDRKNDCTIISSAEEFPKAEYRKRFLELQAPVRDDASKFPQLFQDLPRYCLAFWLLKEWSNWLTPAFLPDNKRFDTVFYLLCVEKELRYNFCSRELQHAEWSCPLEVLRRGHGGDIQLPPPQIYELSRLANFKTTGELNKFAEERESKGVSRYCPQIVDTSEGFHLMLLPGDSFYNTVDPEHVKPYLLNQTAEAIRDSSEMWNHSEFPFSGEEKFPWTQWSFYQKNVNSPNGHMDPVTHAQP